MRGWKSQRFKSLHRNGGDILKITLLYVLLIAGGIWHVLDAFQSLMRILASPILIAISLVLCYEIYRGLHEDSELRRRFLFWCVMIAVGGFVLEIIGVKTGKIFGQYQYGNVLKPLIAETPIAIGFAWLTIQLSALGLVQKLFGKAKIPSIVLPFFTAIIMVVFDFVLEPAAIQLRYWFWIENSIPLQNYLAWFVISLMLSLSGYGLGLFPFQFPRFAIHVYIAQIMYFGVVNLKGL